MKQKLTQWHDGSEKPVHVGVYEVNSGFYILNHYAYWDGCIWNWVAQDIEYAFNWREEGSGLPVTQWRGLAEKPD